MRDDLKDRLRSSFSVGRSPGEEIHAPETPSSEDLFLRDFRAKAERVVVPAMTEIGHLIERHGRFFSIERVPERSTGHGVLVPTSVQMNVFRRHITVNFKNGAPHFNVVCDRVGRRVLFQRTTLMAGAGAEDVGSATLDPPPHRPGPRHAARQEGREAVAEARQRSCAAWSAAR